MQSKILAQGRWLALHEITYRNANDRLITWECVRRVGGRGAASVIATVEIEGEPHLVVVKQYRPPTGGYVLEFPAGLTDLNETAAATAQRELTEETGFRGEIVDSGPSVFNSPGLSDETVSVVRIAVYEQVAATPDGEESIEVLTLPMRDLKARLLAEQTKGVLLDAKLWCFALGLATQS